MKGLWVEGVEDDVIESLGQDPGDPNETDGQYWTFSFKEHPTEKGNPSE